MFFSAALRARAAGLTAHWVRRLKLSPALPPPSSCSPCLP
ncbi:NDUFV2 isoform 8 [Pan troglodytes]|uniref:NDUFV2 isoform 8 n=1 Tax=Pan troglodytes TaxID=9598 RepID=A0A2J8MNU5_PANTR|nr:NDUFV2 isoform 8 [Pan troglodytes]